MPASPPGSPPHGRLTRLAGGSSSPDRSSAGSSAATQRFVTHTSGAFSAAAWAPVERPAWDSEGQICCCLLRLHAFPALW